MVKYVSCFFLTMAERYYRKISSYCLKKWLLVLSWVCFVSVLWPSKRAGQKRTPPKTSMSVRVCFSYVTFSTISTRLKNGLRFHQREGKSVERSRTNDKTCHTGEGRLGLTFFLQEKASLFGRNFNLHLTSLLKSSQHLLWAYFRKRWLLTLNDVVFKFEVGGIRFWTRMTQLLKMSILISPYTPQISFPLNCC